MSLTRKQKIAIHVAAREAGIDPHENEDMYRTVLRNSGGFNSAADRTASHEGFAAVMAVFEASAGGTLSGFTRGYWHKQTQRDRRHDRTIYAIRRELKALNWTEADLDDWIASPHMSNGMFRSLAECPAAWLGKILSGLKAIHRRQQYGRRPRPVEPAPSRGAGCSPAPRRGSDGAGSTGRREA